MSPGAGAGCPRTGGVGWKAEPGSGWRGRAWASGVASPIRAAGTGEAWMVNAPAPDREGVGWRGRSGEAASWRVGRGSDAPADPHTRLIRPRERQGAVPDKQAFRVDDVRRASQALGLDDDIACRSGRYPATAVYQLVVHVCLLCGDVRVDHRVRFRTSPTASSVARLKATSGLLPFPAPQAGVELIRFRGHLQTEQRRCSLWQRHIHRTRRSSGVRWSSWSGRVARRGSWLASSGAVLRPFATGSVSSIATKGVVMTV